MGRKYKFHDDSQLYFVTFTVVNWIDIFIRQEYRDVIYHSIQYCQKEKGMLVFGYCMMPSHIHLIIGTKQEKLSNIVRDLKAFTSRQIRKQIENNNRESRREWIMWMFKRAGLRNERNTDWQFWQQHNHPIELNNYEIALQRLNYIHNNPVVAGFVDNAADWLHSSAGDYFGTRKGSLELLLIER